MEDPLRPLLAETARRASRYLDDIRERRVAPPDEAVASLAALVEPAGFPDDPLPAADVLAFLDNAAGPATVANTGGRYFGFVNGGALPASLAASWLVSTWDQNAALGVMSPAACLLEDQALRWVIDVLGLPVESAAAAVSGATGANFAALCAARHALLLRAGWDADNDGLFGAPPLRVVAGDEVHVSMLKALGLAGFGRNRIERVPADSQGRILVSALPKLDSRTLVCLQAGNVNTGAFDPAGEICARAHEAGAWVHVDGAFGLWAAASPRYAHLAAGFASADSWCTDAHKWPNTVYDCGIVIVRDGSALRHAMTVQAAYLPPGERREPSQHGPEMSRRARGVELWAALRSLGRHGLAGLIDRTCAHARLFAQGLREEAGLDILNEVVINQVLAAVPGRDSAKRTNRIIRAIQEDGTCWCGGTVWQGKTAMRVSVSSWLTTEDDVHKSVAAIARIARAEAMGGLP